jgi:hypothetical protein
VFDPIYVTVDGISTLDKLVQPSKQLLLIDLIPVGIATDINFEQN